MLTAKQIELYTEHKARLHRIAAAAERHKWNAAAKTDKKLLAKCSAVVGPVEANPVRKEPWFHIIDVIDCVNDVKYPSIGEIQRAVCRHFRLQLADLRRRRRFKEIVRPRQIAMYLCREHTPKSLPEIGRMFGGYDHTTIMSNCRVTERRIRSDWQVAYDVEQIERLLA